jgi:hypothetical protein
MNRYAWTWLLVIVSASVAWCVTAGRELGATFDEPLYVTFGHEFWNKAEARKCLSLSGVMPLPPAVDSIPVRIAEWIRGEPFDLTGNYAALHTARLGTIAFWLLLLGSALRAGQIWSGTPAGLLAVTLLALEPIFLGHASLAATDLAFTACLTFFVVVYKSGRDAGPLRRLVLPTIAFAMAFLAKLSALTFVPICIVALEIEHWCSKRSRGEPIRWREPVLHVVSIGVGGLVLVFLGCSRLVEAIRFQVDHNLTGHGWIYLLGESRTEGFWYYFLAAAAIKTSLGLMLVWAGALLCGCRHPRFLWNGPLLAGVALFAASPTCRVQIGIRFMLPALALVSIGAAIALGRHLADCRSAWSRRLTWGMVAAAMMWSASESLQVWPHGIAYANQLFGGPANGYLSLTDSNHDWGQGLPELARWRDKHAAAPIDVCYFGADPAINGPGFRRVNCLDAASLDELRHRYRGRYLAVSTTMLYATPPDLPAVQVLRALPRVDRTLTYFIYDFTDVAPTEVGAQPVSRTVTHP